MQSQDLSAISNHLHCWKWSQAEENCISELGVMDDTDVYTLFFFLRNKSFVVP